MHVLHRLNSVVHFFHSCFDIISINSISLFSEFLDDVWIARQVQRVSDASLKEIPRGELVKVFPKKMQNSKSSLILKEPKTEGSRRKQYLTTPLV